MPKKLISDSSEWSFPLLERFDQAIARLAHEEYGLDTYPNQIEVISSEQMIDAYSSVGLPINYNHWSFGKQFVATEQTYRRGQMGLAYEIVINSDPCIAYLMEENSLPMQALVIAHTRDRFHLKRLLAFGGIVAGAWVGSMIYKRILES